MYVGANARPARHIWWGQLMKIPEHLFSPRAQMRYYVRRQRLWDSLSCAIPPNILLLDAPAGYGKTSAVADLAQQLEHPVAWYPLEFLDHPTTIDFLWNFVRAIQQAIPTFGISL